MPGLSRFGPNVIPRSALNLDLNHLNLVRTIATSKDPTLDPKLGAEI